MLALQQYERQSSVYCRISCEVYTHVYMHYPKKIAQPIKYSCLNASFILEIQQDLPALSGNRQFLDSCFHTSETTSDITQTFWRKNLYERIQDILFYMIPQSKKERRRKILLDGSLTYPGSL